MFPKAWTSVTILLAASLEVHAHAAVAPVLGLGATAPKRSDVKRPNGLAPCGLGVNVNNALAQSTPIQAAADGTFTATVTNFNAGRDGSRQMTAQVDAAATGKRGNFVDMTVTQNGDARPASTGSQQLVATLPAGTKCTGGTTGDLCLVSFKSLGGFGNCVAVQQAAGGGAAADGTASNSTATGTSAAAAAASSAATGADATGATGTGTGTTGTTGTGAGTGAAGAAGAAAGGATGGATGTAATNTGKGKGAKGAAGAAGTGNTGNANNGATGATGSGNAKNGATGAAGNSNANAKNGAAGAASNGNNSGAAGATGATGAATQKANGKGAGAGAGVQGNQNLAKGRFAQGGTRAARALLADLEERGEEMVNNVRRGIVSWIWA